MHSDLAKIMTKQYSAVAANYPLKTFLRVFREQQLKMATTNDSRGYRWHPLKIKWALYLQHKSSSICMRRSDLLVASLSLNSKWTPRDYSHCIKASVGFSDKVDMQLMRAPEVANINAKEDCNPTIG